MTGPRRLVIASGNAHKVEEIADMFARSSVTAVAALDVLSMTAVGEPPEIAETGATFHDNAALKSLGIARWLCERGARGHDLVMSDDSGICVDAFGGAPGVHSARFAGSDATDADNNAKLVRELEGRQLSRSPAHYACVLSLTRVDGTQLGVPEGTETAVRRHHGTLCVEGRCEGMVRTQARGTGGFGYDPYFWVDGESRTFADLSAAEKAARSHRGAAMAVLMRHATAILV